MDGSKSDRALIAVYRWCRLSCIDLICSKLSKTLEHLTDDSMKAWL